MFQAPLSPTEKRLADCCSIQDAKHYDRQTTIWTLSASSHVESHSALLIKFYFLNLLTCRLWITLVIVQRKLWAYRQKQSPLSRQIWAALTTLYDHRSLPVLSDFGWTFGAQSKTIFAAATREASILIVFLFCFFKRSSLPRLVLRGGIAGSSCEMGRTSEAPSR